MPAHAPPLFVAVGATHFNVTNGCIALFAEWKAAGKPAEIHVYDGISAGFGMSKRGLPVDGWIDRFYEWLVARKLTRVVGCGPRSALAGRSRHARPGAPGRRGRAAHGPSGFDQRRREPVVVAR